MRWYNLSLWTKYAVVWCLLLSKLTTNNVISDSSMPQKLNRNGFEILMKGVPQMKTEWVMNANLIQSSCANLVDIYSDRIIRSLKPFERSVKQIKTAAGRLHAKHKFKDDTWKIGNHYYPDRSNMSESVELVRKFSKNVKVNFNISFMQVPVDLFNQRRDLLNEIHWSKHLDDQFKLLNEQESLMTWQYIGFVSGASRTYPGSHLIPS